MVSLYKHHAPSTTSLSDDADDNEEETPQFAFYPEHQQQMAPAQWRDQQAQSIPRPAYHCPISTVPPEILVQILKHLHSPRDLFSAMKVSKMFCQCSVELLWHKPSFPRFDTVAKMCRILGSQTQTFTYARFIRRLNFLNLGLELLDVSFDKFAGCDRLERLTLIGCKHLTTQALTDVLPTFPNLVAIDLSNVVNTTSTPLIGLATVATRLQGINLSGCDKVTDEGVLALAQNCPLLRRVKLSGLTQLTDLSVSALVQSCPMLLEIDLNNCNRLTDVSVRLIWLNLMHMREMRLSHCSLLTDAAFPAPFGGSDYQTDGVNPFGGISIRPDGEDLQPLVTHRIFDNLRMLDLTACPLITDTAVEGLISHAPKIRNLVLSKCVLLTDRAVESICRLGRHLHYLHLGHASKITDRSVRLLARSCTRIRYIDFANCVLLTDMSVFELSALPKLRRIGLVRVNQLTDEAIYALAERHATLERIHLSYCDQISVMAIHFLLLKLHKLTHLSLTGVPAFRQPELQRFCREAPKDFNTAQRLAFCVFSGKGVSQLRTYLTELFDSITEMNNTDDTEYEEDDFDPEGYQEDETPEPETAPEMDVDRAPLPGPSHYALLRVPNTQQVPPSTNHTAVLPAAASAQYHSGVPNQNSAYRRVPSFLPGRLIVPPPTVQPVAGAARYAPAHNSSRYQQRSVADALPIVESSASPSPVNTPAHASAGGSDNGSGFFRTYQDRPPAAVSPRGNGAMTPDLNYAEIGHGRGANTSQSSQGASTVRGHTMNRTPRQQPVARPLAIQDPRPAQDSDSDEMLDVNMRREYRRAMPTSAPASTGAPAWAYREHMPSSSSPVENDPREALPLDGANSGDPSPSSRGRQEQPRSHQDGHGSSSEPRSRSVRRQFKSTLHAAEHYASSLFHRSTGHVNEVAEAGPSTGGSSGHHHHQGAPRSR